MNTISYKNKKEKSHYILRGFSPDSVKTPAGSTVCVLFFFRFFWPFPSFFGSCSVLICGILMRCSILLYFPPFVSFLCFAEGFSVCSFCGGFFGWQGDFLSVGLFSRFWGLLGFFLLKD